MSLSLNQPVGSIPASYLTPQYFITTTATSAEDCQQQAQKTGTCSDMPYCPYYSFTPAPPTQESVMGFSYSVAQPGTCYIGPAKTDVPLDKMPYTAGAPNALYLTPSPNGSTPQQQAVNTVQALIDRDKKILKDKINKDKQQNEGKLRAYEIMKIALQTGQSYDAAQDTYRRQRHKAAITDLKKGEAPKTRQEHEKLQILDQLRLANRDILLDKRLLLVDKSTAATEVGDRSSDLKHKIAKDGQKIMNYIHKSETNDRLARLLQYTLFALVILAILLFIYYGMKLFGGGGNAASNNGAGAGVANIPAAVPKRANKGPNKGANKVPNRAPNRAPNRSVAPVAPVAPAVELPTAPTYNVVD